MDDDVKNLFQKFGQSNENYHEINREAVSEQAMQRWPLLRDVHIHAAPLPSASKDAAPVNERFPERSAARFPAPTPVMAPVAARPVPAAAQSERTTTAQPGFLFSARHESTAPPATSLTVPDAQASQTVGKFLAKVAGAVTASQAAAGEALNAKAGSSSVSALLGRLAAKPETAAATEATGSSFFKRIFKP